MTENVLRKTVYLQASPEKVWSYLTDPEKLAIWFHKPSSPLLEGSYEVIGADSGDKIMWGEVLTANPFHLLEYTFTITPMGDKSSTVKWELEEVPGGTRLSLEHTGLPAGAEAFGLTLALDKGWEEHIGRMRTSLHEA